MKTKIYYFLFVFAMMIGGLQAQNVVVSGNPSCCDIDPDGDASNNLGFKIDVGGMNVNGQWFFVPGDGSVLTCNSSLWSGDPANSITITTTDGIFFDWESTLPIDAIIVKGGTQSNIYYYDPEATSGSGLHAPENGSGSYAEISHIEICFDYEVKVSKSAETSYTRTYAWDISKSVYPESWDLFAGDNGTSEYSVSVTQTGYTDSDWAVAGVIRVENNTPFDAEIASITDMLSGGLGAVATSCTQFPITLLPGEYIDCSYSSNLPDGSNLLNTATVSVSSGSFVGGGIATADVIFGDPTTKVNDEVNITDDNSTPGDASDDITYGPVSADAVWTYSRTFTCSDDAGEYTNIAVIDETDQSASASVSVQCHNLQVSKGASTSFTRTYDWSIDKISDRSQLTLSSGQQFLVNYEVTVDATYTDKDFAVAGEITVYNPASIPATINGVSDLMTGDIAGIVDCSVSFPYTLEPGASLTCSYSADLPDASDRTNIATVNLQNYSYDKDGVPSMNGTTDFSGNANVSFADASITMVDACVDVNDNQVGFLGTVCHDQSPKTYTYSLYVGPYYEPDHCATDNLFVNTASFVSEDLGVVDASSAIVESILPCGTGCTLTIGYWKTHSQQGPAPYDDNWANIGDADGDGTMEEEGEMFMLSGQTYHDVLWTPPAGNVYYNLARQFIGSELNIVNGSDPAAVQTAFDDAYALLSVTTPAQAANLKGKDRKEWTDLSKVLDDFNNGIIGPGHCDEDGASLQSTAVDFDDDISTDIEESDFDLGQNYPNPFRGTTNFVVQVPVSTQIELSVYSLTGQKIATVYNGSVEEGVHHFEYNFPDNIPAGIYIYTLESSETRIIKKMNMLK